MTANKPFNFSAALKRLEEITVRLESPNVDLDEALKLLEEGKNLHKACHEKLTQSQAKITELLKVSNTSGIKEVAKNNEEETDKPSDIPF